MSETFGLSNPVKTHFELKYMCIDLRMFFSSLGKHIFKGWSFDSSDVFVSLVGALTRQTGCQFLQTLIFWSTLKLGRSFIFNTDFRNSGQDTDENLRGTGDICGLMCREITKKRTKNGNGQTELVFSVYEPGNISEMTPFGALFLGKDIKNITSNCEVA